MKRIAAIGERAPKAHFVRIADLDPLCSEDLK